MVSRVAIIPARGGSKRIPKKNICDFDGKPMIAWTIEAALKSGCFDSVVVSTDCEEIATISRQFGADVPFLRDVAADDHSPVSDATIHALRTLRGLGRDYDEVAQLMANCPIRNSEDICMFVAEYVEKSVNVPAISCFKYGWMNPWWAFENKDGAVAPLFDVGEARSQDLPDLFCPTGSIWMAGTEELLKQSTFLTTNRIPVEIRWEAAVDIDDAYDLKFARLLSQLE